MKEKFHVTGMTCSACSSHVEKAVRKLAGVSDVTVNLLQNTMVVTYDEVAVSQQQIVQAVEHAGYGASVASVSASASTSAPGSTPLGIAAAVQPAEIAARRMKRRLIWSIVFLIPLLYIAMGPMIGLPIFAFLDGIHNAITYGMAQLIVTLPILYLNRTYFENGFKSLAHRAPTMDALIALGASAAVIYGIYAIIQMGQGLAVQDFALVHQYHMDLYFESAGTILTLITVGKYLESRSKGKTSEAISRLMDLAPKTAILERDGEEVELPIAQVVVGDILLVRPGSRVPVDGVVIEGIAALDESAITGESMPVEKAIGAAVTGATINNSGFIKIRATRVGEDTTLSQIIRLVEEASASKAPIAKLADQVSGVFVPIVIAIAILTCIIWVAVGYPLRFALSTGIAVLVISCPCALGLATPTAIMVGTGKGAEHGILFRNAESIETAHTVQTIILDKTGTITEGKPSVVGVYPSEAIDAQALIMLAASIEKPSEHPLASAIVEHAASQKIDLLPVSDFKQIPGQGIRAIVQGTAVAAGNARMMEAMGISIDAVSTAADDIAYLGQTPLYITREGELLGLLAIADTLKPTSKQAIAAMRELGLDVLLLTGDNERTANAIARQLGITHVIAGVLPQGKEQIVREQQAMGKKVAMNGDGINDAPALMRADVGIAIGAGTDVAIESADIILMKSDLMDAVTAIQLSSATIRNIKQNLFWAFFYNTLGIPLAAGALYPIWGLKLSPMFASAAMSLSSLFVVSNALRLRLFQPARAKGTAIESTIADDAPHAAAYTYSIPTDQQYNRPLPEEKAEQRKGECTMHVTMNIEGMTCPNCKRHVEAALNALDGIQAEVNLESGTACVSMQQQTASDVLKQAVEDAGYTVLSIG